MLIPTFLTNVFLPTHLTCTPFFISYRSWRTSRTFARSTFTRLGEGAAEFDRVAEVTAHAHAVLDDAADAHVQFEYTLTFFVNAHGERRRVVAHLTTSRGELVRAVSLACPPDLLSVTPAVVVPVHSTPSKASS